MIGKKRYRSLFPEEKDRIAVSVQHGDEIVFFRYTDDSPKLARMVTKKDFDRYFEVVK